MSGPPASVQLGGQPWRVELALLRDDLGRTDPRQCQITVSTRQGPGSLRDSLLHELLHACWSLCALDQDEDEQERIVRSLSPWLLAALRDNPELVAFLTAANSPS